MKKLFTKRIFCRHLLESGEFCNALAATSDGRQLFFDGAPVKNNPRFIGFECPQCGQLIRWRRSFKNPAKNAKNDEV